MTLSIHRVGSNSSKQAEKINKQTNILFSLPSHLQLKVVRSGKQWGEKHCISALTTESVQPVHALKYTALHCSALQCTFTYTIHCTTLQTAVQDKKEQLSAATPWNSALTSTSSSKAGRQALEKMFCPFSQPFKQQMNGLESVYASVLGCSAPKYLAPKWTIQCTCV